jgi:hypothetical protein
LSVLSVRARGHDLLQKKRQLTLTLQTPEQIAFRQKLVAAAESIEYRRMTRNLDGEVG